MKSLKLTIEFKSPLGSMLLSDTIFGHFCWEYRDIFGEDKLKEVLEDFESNPFIVFSDGFVKDTLPMPFLKPKSLNEMKGYFKEKFGDDFDYYSNVKRLKKARFVKVDFFKSLKEDLELFALYDYIHKSKTKTAHFIRNSVHRITNTVQDGLYSTTEVFYGEPVDIYVKYDEGRIDKSTIKKVFESIGRFGFGRDKSTGKGRFEVVEIEDEPKVLARKSTKTFISLSSGVPDEDCEVLYGKTFTKFGKHGRGPILKNPFKNPVVLFKSGSVFSFKMEKEAYGRGLSVSVYHGHCHSAYMLPLFVDVEE